MKHTGLVWGNEEGSVLVYSVIALLLLTLVGLMASRTAVYELNLSGNDRAIHEMRLTSESVAAVGAQLFEELTNLQCRDSDWGSPTRLRLRPWISRGHEDLLSDPPYDPVSRNRVAEDYSKDITRWGAANSRTLLDEQTGVAPDEFRNCRYQVIDMGVARGESLQGGNNNTALHNILVSGLHQSGHRTCLVQIGYRRRF